MHIYNCALNYYILTYLFSVTVIHLLCYFMLCAFVTYMYSIKLLLLLLLQIIKKIAAHLSKMCKIMTLIITVTIVV